MRRLDPGPTECAHPQAIAYVWGSVNHDPHNISPDDEAHAAAAAVLRDFAGTAEVRTGPLRRARGHALPLPLPLLLASPPPLTALRSEGAGIPGGSNERCAWEPWVAWPEGM